MSLATPLQRLWTLGASMVDNRVRGIAQCATRITIPLPLQATGAHDASASIHSIDLRARRDSLTYCSLVVGAQIGVARPSDPSI